jgi:hypothetical protein
MHQPYRPSTPQDTSTTSTTSTTVLEELPVVTTIPPSVSKPQEELKEPPRIHTNPSLSTSKPQHFTFLHLLLYKKPIHTINRLDKVETK